MKALFNQEFILQTARAFPSSVYFLCPYSENFVEAALHMNLTNKVNISWAQLEMKGQPYRDPWPSYMCHWSDRMPLFPLSLEVQPGKVQLNMREKGKKIQQMLQKHRYVHSDLMSMLTMEWCFNSPWKPVCSVLPIGSPESFCRVCSYFLEDRVAQNQPSTTNGKITVMTEVYECLASHLPNCIFLPAMR